MFVEKGSLSRLICRLNPGRELQESQRPAVSSPQVQRLYNTGTAGRPTSIEQLITPEAQRRLLAGENYASKNVFGKILSE